VKFIKLFSLFFLLASLPFVIGWTNTIICGGSIPGAIQCESYEEQNTGSSLTTIGGTTNSWYIGTVYVAPGNIDICKIYFTLTSGGDPSGMGYTYKAYVHELSGADLGALVESSSAVAANNGWSATTVEFSFPTSASISNGVSYGISIARADGGDADSTNYVRALYTQSDLSPLDNAAEDLTVWRNTLVRNAPFDGWDIRIKVYTEGGGF